MDEGGPSPSELGLTQKDLGLKPESPTANPTKPQLRSERPLEKAKPASSDNEVNQAKPETTQQPLAEAEITKSLDYVARLADSALAGHSSPGAVQNYVEYIIRKGVPKDQVEQILKSRGITVERRQETSTSNPFEQFAHKIPIDERRTSNPDGIIAPAGGNMFGDTDRPTLAGRLIAGLVYPELVRRQDYQRPFTPQEIIQKGKDAAKEYERYLQELNQRRVAEGKQPFDLAFQRQAGTDGFHFDGNATPTRDHLFYFNKSSTHWKNPNEQLVRGYVTLSPTEVDQVQHHFVDLATELYDAGIDFTAKAATPLGTVDRTDNMVFYISASDQAKAAELMKKFLTARGLGEGHVAAAMPSPQEGLSWAMEPNDVQRQVWREVSGASTDTSFNSYAATMIMPVYLERLAETQIKLGNTDVANRYRQEAQRVKEVITKLNPTK